MAKRSHSSRAAEWLSREALLATFHTFNSPFLQRRFMDAEFDFDLNQTFYPRGLVDLFGMSTHP